MKCPRCGGELECDMVDVGIGSIQAGPYGCPDCHWVEGEDPDDGPAPGPSPDEFIEMFDPRFR